MSTFHNFFFHRHWVFHLHSSMLYSSSTDTYLPLTLEVNELLDDFHETQSDGNCQRQNLLPSDRGLELTSLLSSSCLCYHQLCVISQSDLFKKGIAFVSTRKSCFKLVLYLSICFPIVAHTAVYLIDNRASIVNSAMMVFWIYSEMVYATVKEHKLEFRKNSMTKKWK